MLMEHFAVFTLFRAWANICYKLNRKSSQYIINYLEWFDT